MTEKQYRKRRIYDNGFPLLDENRDTGVKHTSLTMCRVSETHFLFGSGWGKRNWFSGSHAFFIDGYCSILASCPKILRGGKHEKSAAIAHHIQSMGGDAAQRSNRNRFTQVWRLASGFSGKLSGRHDVGAVLLCPFQAAV